MGNPLDARRRASSDWNGKRIADVVWTVLTRRFQGGRVVQGTDRLSDRDRHDIGIAKQSVSAKFAREMSKLQTIMFR